MREINWDEPLSDEDKQWARQAGLPMVEQRITANEQQFGQESSGDGSPTDPATRSALDSTATGGTLVDQLQTDDDGDDYDSWKVQELKDEADSRQPRVQYASDARKPDLIAALREWDREHG